jgi:preprotein translocase subunit SecG
MLRQRFSLVSVLVMVVATAVVTFLMLRRQGGWFAGQQGLPFEWHWWTDVSYNGSPLHGYRWGGLVVDIVIWFVVIIALGVLVERATQKSFTHHETTNVEGRSTKADEPTR